MMIVLGNRDPFGAVSVTMKNCSLSILDLQSVGTQSVPLNYVWNSPKTEFACKIPTQYLFNYVSMMSCVRICLDQDWIQSGSL